MNRAECEVLRSRNYRVNIFREITGVIAVLLLFLLIAYADHKRIETTYNLTYPLTQQQLSQVLTNRGA